MPMIWGYNYAAGDYIEREWVEDADWDQEAWDEWDHMETLHVSGMLRRMLLVGDYASEWRNMVDGAPYPTHTPRF